MNQRWCMDSKQLKFYHNFEFSHNFFYCFYLGYMDSLTRNLWWTQFEWCLCIITFSHSNMSPRLKRQHRNTIKIMEWMMMMLKVDYFTCTIFCFLLFQTFLDIIERQHLSIQILYMPIRYFVMYIFFCTCVLYFNFHKT
jgi:hypothetical protein